MLKFGNTFVNYNDTYLTGHTKYTPPTGWREVFHTYSAGDSYSYGNTNNECLYNGSLVAPYPSAYTQIDTSNSSGIFTASAAPFSTIAFANRCSDFISRETAFFKSAS